LVLERTGRGDSAKRFRVSGSVLGRSETLLCGKPFVPYKTCANERFSREFEHSVRQF
jgi:hypothetical protein